jgi:hypothetical protein
MMKKKTPLILESYINLTTACSQYQDKWICDETLYRLLNAHYPPSDPKCAQDVTDTIAKTNQL